MAITAGDHGTGRQLIPWIRALAHAGLQGLVIREPRAPADELADLYDTARGLLPWVAVHAKNPHAHTLDAPIHLGATDPRPTNGEWGRSCHELSEVDEALANGATYAFWSPVWRPTSKPSDRRPPIGLDRFLQGAAGRPVLALGGVTPARYARLRRHGASAAVLGGIFTAPEPRTATEWLRQYLRA